MCSDNGEALVRAAIAGQGLVYGPRFIATEALRAGQLVELELDEPPMTLGAAYAITHPTRRPAAKTRAWIDFLAQTLPAFGADW
jgi:DNA-binding transcriptional LysR family regulator